MGEQLSSKEKKLLLRIAREALEIGVQGGGVEPLRSEELTHHSSRAGSHICHF